MRDAPSIPVVSRLVEDRAEGMDQAKPYRPGSVIYAHDAIEAVTGADALVVVTEGNIFRAVAPTRLKGLIFSEMWQSHLKFNILKDITVLNAYMGNQTWDFRVELKIKR